MLNVALLLIGFQGTEEGNPWADPPKLERDCEAGDLEACNTFGNYLSWRGDAAQKKQAIRIYQANCDKGHFVSCSSLSASYRYGSGGAEKDKARAFAIDTDLCTKGYAEGCTSLAYFYETGEGPVEMAPMTGVTYFTKACDLGDADGCAAGANILRRESDEPGDRLKAMTLATKGCDLGGSWACNLKAQLSR